MWPIRLRPGLVFAVALTVLVAVMIVALSATRYQREKDAARLHAAERREPNPIFGRSADELKRATGKISYLGEQMKPVITVVFSTQDSRPDLDIFLDVQRGVRLRNDRWNAIDFIVTPAEFRSILLAVQQFAGNR